jgi:hypothetical protein
VFSWISVVRRPRNVSPRLGIIDLLIS